MAGLIQKQPDGSYHILCRTCRHLIASEVRSPGNFAPVGHQARKGRVSRHTDAGFLVVRQSGSRVDSQKTAWSSSLHYSVNYAKTVGIDSALDVGCGLGDFSGFLSQFGIPRVVGVDGRTENIAEAQKRHVGPLFQVADAEELPELGCFDLVLCFGLLYHLENPIRAIRKLQAATSKVLLLESMCIHAQEPRLELMDEATHNNQGLNYLAMYPSEPALVKMLHRSGFSFVYGFRTLPNNEFYRTSKWRVRMRTMMLASRIELQCENLVPLQDYLSLTARDASGWKTTLAKIRDRLTRA